MCHQNQSRRHGNLVTSQPQATWSQLTAMQMVGKPCIYNYQSFQILYPRRFVETGTQTSQNGNQNHRANCHLGNGRKHYENLGALRAKFAYSVMVVMEQLQLDGIYFQWMWPGCPRVPQNYTEKINGFSFAYLICILSYFSHFYQRL
jgi:hypothetical protein